MLLRYVADLHMETLLTFLCTLTIWRALAFHEKPSIGNGVILGALGMITTLTKGVLLPFVLFWSAEAAKSEWVRLEINMAFIQLLRQKAIRLRVVMLDNTPLPLYLKPFHAFTVIGSPDPVKLILEKLSPLLREPIRSARARFVNRHDDVGRIEEAVDDPEIHIVWLSGFIGVGKTSLVHEALRRIFEGVDFVNVRVSEGTGFVELALTLNALARNETLQESLPHEEIQRQIRLRFVLILEVNVPRKAIPVC